MEPAQSVPGLVRTLLDRGADRAIVVEDLSFGCDWFLPRAPRRSFLVVDVCDLPSQKLVADDALVFSVLSPASQHYLPTATVPRLRLPSLYSTNPLFDVSAGPIVINSVVALNCPPKATTTSEGHDSPTRECRKRFAPTNKSDGVVSAEVASAGVTPC